MRVSLACALALSAGILALAPAVAQPKATLLDTFKNWFVYRAGAGAAKTCYALGQPEDSDPPGLNRQQPFFLVSNWPAKKKAGEPSIVPGFPYKEGSVAQVQVGSDTFKFFTQGDTAWAMAVADEKRLLSAMRRGSSMSITGISARGTLVRDTYSLAGLSAALDKAAAACK